MSPKAEDRVLSDPEYLRVLREAVSEYLRALDAWESESHRVSRLQRTNSGTAAGVEELREAFHQARSRLKPLIPRARRLCLRYDLREPWSGILKVDATPRRGPGPRAATIGRNERATLTECLAQMEAGVIEEQYSERPVENPASSAPATKSLLRRILDYFF